MVEEEGEEGEICVCHYCLLAKGNPYTKHAISAVGTWRPVITINIGCVENSTIPSGNQEAITVINKVNFTFSSVTCKVRGND